MEDEISCHNCAHSLEIDYGYSNWTVMGTDVHCIKSIHPDNPYDKWYGKDERAEYAKECKAYLNGEPVAIEVEWVESDGGLNQEQLAYVKEYAGR